MELSAESRRAARLGGVRGRQPGDDQDVANGASVETVAPDGESLPDRASRKIAPTIVRDIDGGMEIANEEIFGPVLAVRPYSQPTDAIDYINQRLKRR